MHLKAGRESTFFLSLFIHLFFFGVPLFILKVLKRDVIDYENDS